jgi:hypothetical protein
LRLPVGMLGVATFVMIAACGGLVGAGGGLALGWLIVQAFPGIGLEPAFVGGVVLVFPLALWAQFRLLKFVRPRLAMLERRLSRGSVVAYADVRQPFTLLLRAFSDDVMVVHRTPINPLGLLTENRLETWIVDALRSIGPVVAVGLPGEELPHTGAARLYLDHEVWQERVGSLIRGARATVIIVGESEGVWWEIETALSAVAASRLALVFPLAMTPDRMITGFYRRDEVPTPRTPRHLLARLDRALLDAGFAPMPEPTPGDQILILDDDRRPRFLATRMTLTYYLLLLNPVTILMRLLWRLYPAVPWRMSLSGEISYRRTFAPFVRLVLAHPTTATQPL